MLALLRALAKGVGTLVLLVVATAGGVLANMDTAAVRRAVVARLNGVLASTLAGRIVIDRVGGWGPTHVHDVDAHVDDPEGKTVLRVWGLDARVSTVDLLASLTSGKEARIAIDALSVARADVNLEPDATGTPRIARAFTPPPPSGPPGGGGIQVRLALPHAILAHVVVHGQPPGAPPIDADVDVTDASVSVAPGVLGLEVRHAQIVARGLPDGLTTRGTLNARFTQPAADGSDHFVHASWQGQVGELVGTGVGDIRRARARGRGGGLAGRAPRVRAGAVVVVPLRRAGIGPRRGAWRAAVADGERSGPRGWW